MKARFFYGWMTAILISACSQDVTTDAPQTGGPLLPQEDLPLIEKVQTGGFRATPRKLTLTLHRSGEISRSVWVGTTNPSDPGTTETVSLGKLAPPVMDYLTVNANELVDGTLQFDPNAPICADAPVNTYTAYSTKHEATEAIIFMKRENCVDKKLVSGPAMNLIEVSKAMDSLSNATVN